MTFTKLYTDSTVADAIKYLKELAASPFAYHLDDSCAIEDDDFNWGCEPKPDRETIMTMSINSSLIWRMHEEGVWSWNEAWEVYGAAWDEADAKKQQA